MKFNGEQFKEAISTADSLGRNRLLQEFAADNKLSMSAEEIIAFAQMVCDIGCGNNPPPDSVCAIINTL